MEYEKTLARMLGRTHYLVSRRLNKLLQQSGSGITADQFKLLAALWTKDGITQRELSVRLGRDRAGITRMVDILEEQGLLTRISDKDDRRINLIYLTKKGRELEPLAAENAQQSLDDMTCGFSEEEKKQFAHLLSRAIENLK